MGEYTALDDEMVDMIRFLRKNGVRHFIMADGVVDIAFQPGPPALVYCGTESVTTTRSDETSNYCMDKDKN